MEQFLHNFEGNDCQHKIVLPEKLIYHVWRQNMDLHKYGMSQQTFNLQGLFFIEFFQKTLGQGQF